MAWTRGAEENAIISPWNVMLGNTYATMKGRGGGGSMGQDDKERICRQSDDGLGGPGTEEMA